jgi:microcystin degradation protein MlrC
LPVDGCLVVPHGAAVSESFPDMDGHWLSLLRNKLGKHIPVIGTLDPHANASPLMIASTDGLIAYKTNPHIDQRQVGKEAADLMVHILKGDAKPVQMLVQPPLAISIEQQYTSEDPCKSLYAYARQLSQEKEILSISIILGFPYADVTEMGTSFIIIADRNKEAAMHAGKQLESYVMDRLDHFSGKKMDTAAALSLLEDSVKPILLLDMGDNIGGGSPGNSLHLLKALERSGLYKSFVCIYDPEAVITAAKYDPGDIFTLSLTDTDKSTYAIEATLQQLADGRFAESAPRHGGQVNYNMGNIAIVSTAKGNVVMLTSQRVPPFSLRQLTAFGIFPCDFEVVVAKGVNAPIAAYGPECPTVIQVNTPGVTQADMTAFIYKSRRKPLFPFEKLHQKT